MNASNKKLGAFAGAMTLAVGLGIASTQMTGCDEAAKACNLNCPDNGVAEGNASITGYIAVDAFFKSVVNFKAVATGVAADIRAELSGIQGAFGISDAEVKAKGSLAAALQAKLQGAATIKVKAQPARCEVDASFSAQASASCQAEAQCEVDPGKASVKCEGRCTAEVAAAAECTGGAEVRCDVSGPQVNCEGECSGTCTGSCSVTLDVAGKCEGSCNGTCDGSTTSGGSCAGMCKGTCELSGNAAASCSGQCKGSCSGSCNFKAPSGGCEANAKIECRAEAKADFECKGTCEGEFEPPKAMCDASASCEASAKAEAKFQAHCEPPSVTIDASFTASGAARAQLEYGVADLRVRLPRLLAALKKANVVLDAGKQLGADGVAAVKGTLDGIASGEVGAVAAFRIAKCAPSELDVSAKAIADSGKGLTDQVTAAGSLTTALNM